MRVQYSYPASPNASTEFRRPGCDIAIVGHCAPAGKGVALARDRLVAAARRQASQPRAGDEYYGGGPEEPAEEEPVPIQEQIDGLITRNHYGCIVLNAAHALFIDVDVLDERQRCRPIEPWQQVLDDLRTVLSNERDEGFRIYRTAAGFRIIASGREYEPASPRSAGLMECVGADADFVSLCRIQNSFRARLTPKPWRCGARRPPNFFPRDTLQENLCFTQWLTGYERACRGYATCQYLGHVGSEYVHERIAPIVELHDRETNAHAALPLA
jgi:hypothetical protein